MAALLVMLDLRKNTPRECSDRWLYTRLQSAWLVLCTCWSPLASNGVLWSMPSMTQFLKSYNVQSLGHLH